MKIEITNSTIAKYSPYFQSSDINDESLKFSVNINTKLEINWYKIENGHYLVELEKPINGRFNWYFFYQHCKIIDEDLSVRKKVSLQVPYLSQRDNTIRPFQTCNMTCAAMVIEYFYPGTIKKNNPKQLEDILTDEVVKKWGSSGIYYHSNIVNILNKWGVESKFSTNTSFKQIKESLDNKNPVIFSGKFTKSGHIIVITGYDDISEHFIVNDPYGEFFYSGYRNSNTNGKQLKYSFNLIENLSYGGQNNCWAHLCSKK